MAEKVKGLPAGFALDVPAKAGKPLQWGNYLEDEASPPLPANVVQMERSGASTERREGEGDGEAVEARPKRGGGQSRNVRIVDRVEKTQRSPAQPKVAARKAAGPRPKRKQINMTPETLDRFGELLDLLRERSVQKDLHASELMDALVHAASEACESFEFSKLPARGRWGDPAAFAFRGALRGLVAESIARHRKVPARTRVQMSEETPGVDTSVAAVGLTVAPSGGAPEGGQEPS